MSKSMVNNMHPPGGLELLPLPSEQEELLKKIEAMKTTLINTFSSWGNENVPQDIFDQQPFGGMVIVNSIAGDLPGQEMNIFSDPKVQQAFYTFTTRVPQIAKEFSKSMLEAVESNYAYTNSALLEFCQKA